MYGHSKAVEGSSLHSLLFHAKLRPLSA